MAKHINVLIVEDSEDDAMLLLRELGKGGYEPVYERVENSKDMRKALATGKWDIVISDYMMPSLNGLEALAIKQQLADDIPFIVVSGTVGEEVAVQVMKAGAEDYLMKDSLTRLSAAVERELRDAEIRRKKLAAEELLKETEDKYSVLFDSAADSIMIIAFENLELPVIVDCNKAALQMLRCSRKDMIGKGVDAFSADLQENGEPVRSVLTGIIQGITNGDPQRLEWVGKKHTGQTIFVDLNVTPIMLSGKMHALAIGRDITLKIESERKLKEAEQEWQRTFDAIPDMVFVQDSDHNLLKVNKAFLDAMNMKKEDVLGKKCYEVLHKRDEPWPGCPYEKTRYDMKVHSEEIDDPAVGKSLLVTTSPMVGTDGVFQGAIHVAKDLSEFKRLTEAQEKHLDELEVFYRASMDREDKIIELKKRVEELEEELKISRGE